MGGRPNTTSLHLALLNRGWLTLVLCACQVNVEELAMVAALVREWLHCGLLWLCDMILIGRFSLNERVERLLIRYCKHLVF